MFKRRTDSNLLLLSMTNFTFNCSQTPFRNTEVVFANKLNKVVSKCVLQFRIKPYHVRVSLYKLSLFLTRIFLPSKLIFMITAEMK